MTSSLLVWSRRIALLLGVVAMGAATAVSRPYEEGFWGAPRPCRAWSDPCTHEQARAMVLHTELAWWLGVVLVLIGLAGPVLVRSQGLRPDECTPSRRVPAVLLALGALATPGYFVAQAAAIWLGSLFPLTVVVLMLALAVWLLARHGDGVRRRVRLTGTVVMVLCCFLVRPWFVQLGDLYRSLG